MDPNSPCHDQSAAGIEHWLRTEVRVGTPVVIRTMEKGSLHYQLARVVGLGNGRFEVDIEGKDPSSTSAKYFYFSGKSCRRYRTARLVLPTEAVLQACRICESSGGFLRGTYRCSFS